MMMLNGASALETTEFMASKIDLFGTPEAYNHYAVGWAHAMDTPYQWTKQVASHWGGTRNGTIVQWPTGFPRGRDPSQFHHVIDVAPTVLEAAGLPQPTVVDGVSQRPIEGVEHDATRFDDGSEADRRTTQYFEMFCNRGIYHEGWAAVTRHSHALGDRAELPRVRRRRLGALRHQRPTGARRTTSPPRCPTSSPSSRSSSSRRLAGTASCRSTIAGSSASTPTSPADRR